MRTKFNIDGLEVRLYRSRSVAELVVRGAGVATGERSLLAKVADLINEVKMPVEAIEVLHKQSKIVMRTDILLGDAVLANLVFCAIDTALHS
ncbi:MAG: hypothetical protein K2H87_02070 [Duncaniella sp.]|nr:hypothetical protein [Duncaniella sp.]